VLAGTEVRGNTWVMTEDSTFHKTLLQSVCVCLSKCGFLRISVHVIMWKLEYKSGMSKYLRIAKGEQNELNLSVSCGWYI
jgi:hypothetical protein